jgi:hypothetical protein
MFYRSLFVILSMVFLPLCFLSWYLQLLRSLVFCVMFYWSLFVISGQKTQWQKDKKIKWQTTIYKTLHRKLKISLQLLRSLVSCAMFCRSLFVILSMVFLPLCFLSWYLQPTINKTLHRKLKISEAVNIRTENTMAKRQKTKWQTTIYKTLHLSFCHCVLCPDIYSFWDLQFPVQCFVDRCLSFCLWSFCHAQETKDLRRCKYQDRKHNGKKTKR